FGGRLCGKDPRKVLFGTGQPGGLHCLVHNRTVPIEMELLSGWGCWWRLGRLKQDRVASDRRHDIADSNKGRVNLLLACRLVVIDRTHVQRLMDVPDEMREEPDRFRVG